MSPQEAEEEALIFKGMVNHSQIGRATVSQRKECPSPYRKEQRCWRHLKSHIDNPMHVVNKKKRAAPSRQRGAAQYEDRYMNRNAIWGDAYLIMYIGKTV